MKKEKLPNILFFFTDQQRWDTAGCYGQELDITPNLDRMADEGVKFEYAFTCQPVCGPARSCLQTGKYATETGCFRNAIALPLEEKTIAHHFAEAGYETGYIGKWHLASTDDWSSRVKGEEVISFIDKPIPPERRCGYNDYWVASDVLEHTSHSYDGHMFNDGEKVDFEGVYRVDWETDFVLEFLRSRTRAKPFFLFVSYIEPHHQNDHNRYEGPHGSKERFANYKIPEDLIDTTGDWQENFPDYLGAINSLDHNFGRIRNELEKLGMADNTLIVYTSDHGSHFRTRNSEYKRSCHDACIRIPMVIHGPGFTSGTVIDNELVSLIDLPPTLLAAAGIEKPASMKGLPLQELVAGTASDWPQEVFLQISESQVGRAIRTKKWTYSVYAPDKDGVNDPCSDTYVEQYLYDNENDPHQKNNLITDPALKDTRADLASILKRSMIEAGEQEPEIVKAGT